MPRLTRGSAQRTSLTVAAAGLALVLMLTMSACQPGGGQTPAPTPTTPPDATSCSQVYGFSGAPVFDLPGFQLPAGTVGVRRAQSSGANQLTVVEYAICVPPGQFGVSGGSLGVIFGGNWQPTPGFPADGRTFTACRVDTPTSATPPSSVQTVPAACAQLPTMVFALADEGTVQGQGLLVFRLRIASPPHPCGGSFFPTMPGTGYPKDVLPLQGYDETQVPLPPLSLTGQPRVSFQAADGANSPYAVVPVCTQGTSQSILSDLQRLMPGEGWAPQNAQGTLWLTSTQGGGRMYARFDGLATPQNWTLTMTTNLNEVPVFPTPVPAGPDALCSSVPGLAQATPLRLADPGADFPGDTVAVVARTTRGSVYTITDYFGCAPHFELTSNPANGSGGYPLYAVFDQQEWNYANSFPFDGANLQSCDYTPVGNYLTQFCRTNGSVYVEIERVAEPGKGLVTFHLLYARKN